MPKRGEHVIALSGGKSFDALVLDAVVNDERLGANGEPSLNLCMVLEPLKPLRLGETLEPTIQHDVVHVSAKVKENRGSWEWKESLLSSELLSPLLATEVSQNSAETLLAEKVRKIKGV